METDELCPRLWPEILWELLHGHPHGPGDPEPWRQGVDEVLSALAINALSWRLTDPKLAQGIRAQAAEQIVAAARQLGQSRA
ncbi:hypothetical protein ASG87_11265 [Frateuria sp. Soil773]|uniref:hypothetical protein n=1 Tax=Frateuria sp. Soil773 TaxID=1736407 RepID=UPI0006F69B4D|nr:hypothetical protein [Frateuria sp. Soil773]KRF02057.1 hypothetical protein ASG87_11265 [Frateuria sp. Soil773]